MNWNCAIEMGALRHSSGQKPRRLSLYAVSLAVETVGIATMAVPILPIDRLKSQATGFGSANVRGLRKRVTQNPWFAGLQRRLCGNRDFPRRTR